MSSISFSADPAINDFIQNPRQFLTPEIGAVANALSAFKVFPAHEGALPGGIPNDGYFKFVAHDEYRPENGCVGP